MEPVAMEESETTRRQQMARFGALLFGGGAVVTALGLVLPHQPEVDEGGLAAVAAAAGLVAALLTIGGERFPMWAYRLIPAAGTVLVSFALLFNGERHGGPAGGDEMYYLWVVLYSAYYLGRIATGVQVILLAAAYGATLAAIDPGPIAVSRWLSTIGLVVGAALVVNLLSERVARLVGELKVAALHDPLTGLPNRRSLLADLEQQLSRASKEHPLLVVLFDLDGFKAYNDTFGHGAGDALLTRLGRNLVTTVGNRGLSYRMGGDEFCILASLHANSAESITQAAAASLAEHGEGFSVTASYGAVLLPMEATNSAEALRIADQRMYARKSVGSRASAGRQSTDVLLKVLSERSPDLGIHLDQVTMLCQAVAAKLGLPEDEAAPLLQAASLHDVGKAAIPDEILKKPGPLGAEEWQFMRRHTLIGERILSAAPALAQAAALVRSSHERFDGKGYPDGLAGEDIPLGARVIAVCDAFDAMVCGRFYRAPMSIEVAVAELRRCAGTQFDPTVVDAFCAVVSEHQNLTANPGRELIATK
jgi:diguanylate cyclase (GGDEF)-like protein